MATITSIISNQIFIEYLKDNRHHLKLDFDEHVT
jgi:hypothetical protein